MHTIARTPAISTNIVSYAYCKRSNRLFVEFLSGWCYYFLDVPPATATALMDATSIGKFFNQVVKDNFQFERVSGFAEFCKISGNLRGEISCVPWEDVEAELICLL